MDVEERLRSGDRMTLFSNLLCPGLLSVCERSKSFSLPIMPSLFHRLNARFRPSSEKRDLVACPGYKVCVGGGGEGGRWGGVLAAELAAVLAKALGHIRQRPDSRRCVPPRSAGCGGGLLGPPVWPSPRRVHLTDPWLRPRVHREKEFQRRCHNLYFRSP